MLAYKLPLSHHTIDTDIQLYTNYATVHTDVKSTEHIVIVFLRLQTGARAHTHTRTHARRESNSIVSALAHTLHSLVQASKTYITLTHTGEHSIHHTLMSKVCITLSSLYDTHT